MENRCPQNTSFPSRPRPPSRSPEVPNLFPVRRIWCVGRNYLEHIKEMGQDEREPPFFFAKPADAIVHDGGTVPYPPLTSDLHHEVEMVVALKSGGRNIPKDKALDCVWGYGVGIDLTRRDLQIASRNIKRPWEIGKAFDGSAPCGPLQPASKIGHPSKGRIWLKVNGEVKQDGDLEQMIWNVPEIIWKLSEMVALEAGDIIMTGTPAGVSALAPGHKLECEVEGVGKVSGDDRAEGVASPTSARAQRRSRPAANLDAPLRTAHAGVGMSDHTTAVMPPSTNRMCPLTNDDASQARKIAAPCNSSTLPQRPAGVRAQTQAENFSSAISAWLSSVPK